jgi:hypothetical protein
MQRLERSESSQFHTPEKSAALIGMFIAFMPVMELDRVKLAALGVLLVLLAEGCASLGDGHPATVELSSKASEPVGKTVPVFIKVHCTDHCGKRMVGLSRSEVFALDKSGKWVQALRTNDAVELAGGTQPLLDAVGSGEGNSGFIVSSAAREMYPTNPGPLALTGLPILFGLAHAGYRAAHPEDVLMERLEAISIPEQGSHDYYQDAWVFFPTATYTEVKASYTWFSDFSSRARHTETLRAPWNGSSTSLDPAAKTEIVDEKLTQKTLLGWP